MLVCFFAGNTTEKRRLHDNKYTTCKKFKFNFNVAVVKLYNLVASLNSNRLDITYIILFHNSIIDIANTQ